MPLGAARFGLISGVSGSLELIQTQTFSSQSTINFTSSSIVDFDVHFFTFNHTLGGNTPALRVSSDGGSSWTQLSGGGSGTSNMHVDQHNVQFIDGNKVIFSNDGGVYYSSNAGLQIPNRNEGYNVSQFYSVALHPNAGSKYVLGGTQDNGSWKVDGTTLSNGTYQVQH